MEEKKLQQVIKKLVGVNNSYNEKKNILSDKVLLFYNQYGKKEPGTSAN